MSGVASDAMIEAAAKCEMRGIGVCAAPARYVIRWDEDFIDFGCNACEVCTAEARANDPLGYIVSVRSLSAAAGSSSPGAQEQQG